MIQEKLTQRTTLSGLAGKAAEPGFLLAGRRAGGGIRPGTQFLGGLVVLLVGSERGAGLVRGRIQVAEVA